MKNTWTFVKEWRWVIAIPFLLVLGGKRAVGPAVFLGLICGMHFLAIVVPRLLPERWREVLTKER